MSNSTQIMASRESLFEITLSIIFPLGIPPSEYDQWLVIMGEPGFYRPVSRSSLQGPSNLSLYATHNEEPGEMAAPSGIIKCEDHE